LHDFLGLPGQARPRLPRQPEEVMQPITIRDSFDARRFLVQGLRWQRVKPVSPAETRTVLTWIKELATAGQPLPPAGFVADIGHVALGEDWEARSGREPIDVPNLPINLVRTYEDHVLGKIYADWSFTRGADALRRYARGREQARGLAFLIGQYRERAGFQGVEMSPGVINAALEVPPEEVLSEGWESLRQEGVHPLLPRLYESLIDSSRRTGEVLGPDDIFHLERKTALDEYSQRLAFNQVIRAAAGLEATLPRTKVKPLARRMEVPTRILEEDMYPVGGFTSLSNKGSIESLLHSQLAYMEPDANERPDLFDTMFLMDELLYYARDENQFLRRRRTFVFVLPPELVETRFKDADLPFQRGVMLLGLLVVVVRKLKEWLSTDALQFHCLFLGEGENEPLAHERNLLETIHYEDIALEIIHVGRTTLKKLPRLCEDWARKSMVHVLMTGVEPEVLEAKETVITRLGVKSARPTLADGDDDLALVEGDDAPDSWAQALQQILMRWV
jgi:hypothetical protein